jgi:hypothetical protein
MPLKSGGGGFQDHVAFEVLDLGDDPSGGAFPGVTADELIAAELAVGTRTALNVPVGAISV